MPKPTHKPKTRKQPSVVDQTFRTAVKRAMKAQDHTIADLSRATGLGRLTISRWLTGYRDIYSDKLILILRHLDVVPGAYSAKRAKS